MNIFTFFSYQTCFIVAALSPKSAYEKALKSKWANSCDPISPKMFDEYLSMDEALASVAGCEFTVVTKETMV